MVVLAARPGNREDDLVLGGVSIQATVSWVPGLERELVERARRGDEEAFHELASRVGDRLFSMAHHILRDPDAAEDAAQQALLDIWRNLPRLNDVDRFGAWSYRIVVRAAYAEASRRRRWIVTPIRLASSLSPEPDHAGAAADRDQLDRGFKRLSVEHRAVVALKYFADRTDDQIAEILEIPVGTVRSRLHHSLRSLRAELEADARTVLEGGLR
jgi:RNA polymerase sigma-70 factor (ECF subfamily)